MLSHTCFLSNAHSSRLASKNVKQNNSELLNDMAGYYSDVIFTSKGLDGWAARLRLAAKVSHHFSFGLGENKKKEKKERSKLSSVSQSFQISPLCVGKMVRRIDTGISSQVVTLPHMACSSISLIKQQAEAKMPNCQPHSSARFVCRHAPKLIQIQLGWRKTHKESQILTFAISMQDWWKISLKYWRTC